MGPLVVDCFRCDRLAACRHYISQGNGAAEPAILFVGQNPGDQEDMDKQGRPFIGRAGQLAKYLCEAADVPRADVRWVNAVRCHSPSNAKPTTTEVENCHDYLLDEITATHPGCIVALGETAFHSLYLLPRHRQALHRYEQGALADWQRECQRIQALTDHAVADWEASVLNWQAAGGKKGTGEAKPLKPKPQTKPKVPKKPVKEKMSMTSVAGVTLFQPETGIPLIVTYHPSWIMRGKWDKADLVTAHYKKAYRIGSGEQAAEGQLGDYHVIQTLSDLIRLRDYLLSDEVEKIYFDTETIGPEDKRTDGTNWMRAELLCISLAGKAGEGWVVPILQQGGETCEWWHGLYKQVIAILKEIFGCDKPKEGQNLLFDLAILEREADWPFIDAETAFGIKVNGYLEDTELKHQMVAETLPHNMTSVLAMHTDMPFYEEEIHHLSQGKKRMDLVPNEITWKYSGADADGLPRIDGVLEPIIVEEGTDFVLEEIAQPLLRLCWNMQKRGVPIDIEYFGRLCQFYALQVDRVEQELYDCVPDYDWFQYDRLATEKKRAAGKKVKDKNYDDKTPKYLYPPVLQDLLFRHLALPVPDRKTKGGRNCEPCRLGICFDHIETGKDALKDIKSAMGPNAHLILDILLELKALVKVRGTYLDGGKGGWKIHIRDDDRIHPTVQVSRVETGRLAFKRPSIQNPPKGIHIHPKPTMCGGKPCPYVYDEAFGIDTTNAFRDIIAAPEGYGIMNVDWNQLEVWVLAYKLRDQFGDRTLLDVLESGLDIHTFAARNMFPAIDPELADHEWRRAHGDLRDKAKVFVFGCVPMDTQALTPSGWKTYGQLEKGDPVYAYDPGIRQLVVTPIEEKVYYEEADLVRLQNRSFDVMVTPNHRWYSRRRTSDGKTKRYEEGYRHTYDLSTEDNLIVAAPATDTGEQLLLSKEESELLGWYYGDGWSQGAISICQTKPEGVERIRHLLRSMGYAYAEYPPRANGNYSWRLTARSSRALSRKAQLDDGLETLVLRMTSAQRKAFLAGLLGADGSKNGRAWVLTQNEGSVLEAGRLAMFLEGAFPTSSLNDTRGNMPNYKVRASKPVVTGQKLRQIPAGRAPVWCIKTKYGSWVMRQGDCITITGNTNYGLTIPGTMERLHCTEEEAKDLMSRWLRVCPGLPKYFAYIRKMVMEEGYVDDRFLRRRHTGSVDLLRQMGERNELEGLVRECFNMPIQAGGSDLHSYVSVATDQYEPLINRDVGAIFSVHDSLTFLFPWPDNDAAVEIAWLIKNLWQKLAWNMPTPEGERLHWKTVCEVEWGRTWGTPKFRLNSRGVLENLKEEATT